MASHRYKKLVAVAVLTLFAATVPIGVASGGLAVGRPRVASGVNAACARTASRPSPDFRVRTAVIYTDPESQNPIVCDRRFNRFIPLAVGGGATVYHPQLAGRLLAAVISTVDCGFCGGPRTASRSSISAPDTLRATLTPRSSAREESMTATTPSTD